VAWSADGWSGVSRSLLDTTLAWRPRHAAQTGLLSWLPETKGKGWRPLTLLLPDVRNLAPSVAAGRSLSTFDGPGPTLASNPGFSGTSRPRGPHYKYPPPLCQSGPCEGGLTTAPATHELCRLLSSRAGATVSIAVDCRAWCHVPLLPQVAPRPTLPPPPQTA